MFNKEKYEQLTPKEKRCIDRNMQKKAVRLYNTYVDEQRLADRRRRRTLRALALYYRKNQLEQNSASSDSDTDEAAKSSATIPQINLCSSDSESDGVVEERPKTIWVCNDEKANTKNDDSLNDSAFNIKSTSHYDYNVGMSECELEGPSATPSRTSNSETQSQFGDHPNLPAMTFDDLMLRTPSWNIVSRQSNEFSDESSNDGRISEANSIDFHPEVVAANAVTSTP